MPELRWILGSAGVLLIIGIVVYGMRQRNKSTTGVSIRSEPSYSPVAPSSASPPKSTVVSDDEIPQVSMTDAENTTGNSAPLYSQSNLPLESDSPAVSTEFSGDSGKSDEKVIAIHVAARAGQRFKGPDIVSTLEAENLELGDFEIFHRRTGKRSVFSVSSMVEPGTFNPETIDAFSTPGLSFFMIMPGPDSPVSAFTEMLSTARRVAAVLNAEVLDESGSTLSRQAASHLREQIIEFAHRVR